MRKIYTLIMSAAMMLCASVAKAAVPVVTLTDSAENVVAQFEKYGVFHSYNFKTWSLDGEALPAYATSPTSVTINKTGCVQCISSPAVENLYCAVGRGTIETPDLRWRENYGIYEFGSGGRLFSVENIKAGMIIVLQGGQNGSWSYADGTTPTPELTKEITDSIHGVQAQKDLDEDGEADGWHDSYRYFMQLQDGNFNFTVNRACFLSAMLILIDQSAEEKVDEPVFKITKVNGESRTIEIKTGQSTYGAECSTWWGILEADERALYLEDTDEIDHYDEVYETDEETGEQKLVSSTPVYKQKLVPDDGSYGDRLYEEPFTVDKSDDVDGDGYITIVAASVSANGAFSNIITNKLSVGEVTLNTPNLVLCNFDESERKYRLEWTNNTICQEDYRFTIEGDNGAVYEELEPNKGIGSTFSFKSSAKVTVSVEGYLDGVYELSEVDLKDVTIYRKNKDVAEAGKHDYNFTEPTTYQKALIKQDYNEDSSIIEKCFILSETGDSIFFSTEEFIEGISTTGVDLTSATPILKESGWNEFDSKNARTTLHVESSESYAGELYNVNSNGYGYVKDQANIFGNIKIDCAPNAANNSCIFTYIDKSDWPVSDTNPEGGYNGDGITKLGAYFMADVTFTFGRDIAKPGELIVIYGSFGTTECSSNSTSIRRSQVVVVPTDAEASIKFPGGSHILYIDVYSYDNLPEDVYDPTGVNTLASEDTTPVAIYTTSGARANAMQKGINIVKMSDGSVKKIFVK